MYFSTQPAPNLFRQTWPVPHGQKIGTKDRGQKPSFTPSLFSPTLFSANSISSANSAFKSFSSQSAQSARGLSVSSQFGTLRNRNQPRYFRSARITPSLYRAPRQRYREKTMGILRAINDRTKRWPESKTRKCSKRSTAGATKRPPPRAAQRCRPRPQRLGH